MKVGLFFGSFNPVHVGHMVIANYMYAYTDLEQIWFVVSPQNPLKKKDGLLNHYDRLHLVKLAIGDDQKLRASDIEFTLPQPNYTVDTLTYMREKYPHHTFALIMGGDNLASLHKWKNYELLLKNYAIYVYDRTDVHNTEYINHANIHFSKAPMLNISATFIRDAISEGLDIRHFLPESVWRYIHDMGYYKK